MSHNARRCSARRKDGRPCQAWAMRSSAQPLCARHQTRPQQPEPDDEQSSFYGDAYDLEEVADLLYKAEEKDLTDELSATRVAVRRILQQLQQELEPADFARLVALIFKGTHTIADIMRAQRDLSKLDIDQLPPEYEAALTEILQERGLDR